MKSPFPGMDPYLESRWGDVHSSLAIYTRNQLQAQLPKDLRARVEEHVVVEDDGESTRKARWKPDVRVVDRPQATDLSSVDDGSVAVAEPIVVGWDSEPSTQRSVRIIDSKDNSKVITAIEFLSPINKQNARERKRYRRKQKDMIDGGVSLIEIDLVRVGKYVLAAPKKFVPDECLEPYRVCVTRGWEPARAELYRVDLRSRLPVIRVPLRETDSDVRLDLQAILDRAYEDSGYDDLDYTQDANPPLTGDDAAWADELLRKAGRR